MDGEIEVEMDIEYTFTSRQKIKVPDNLLMEPGDQERNVRTFLYDNPENMPTWPFPNLDNHDVEFHDWDADELRFTKPDAVIMDLDGCLVDVSSTRQYVLGPKKDFDKFHTATLDCPPHADVAEWMVKKRAEGKLILVLTGRKEKWWSISHQWLTKHAPCDYVGPFMRPEDDHRPSAEFKQDMFTQLSRAYNITEAADDDPSVDAMWKAQGLKTFFKPGWDDQVAAAYVDQANKEGS